MRSEVVFAGFGGQGVIKAALLLALAAVLEEKEVAQTQSYGPEARGGACRSEVIISDEKIDYIKAERIDAFVVMSQPAMEKYAEATDPENTVIIADTTLVQPAPEKSRRLYPVRATSVSEETFGRSLFANIIMLGALSAVTGIVSISSLEKALTGNVPPETIEQNRNALKKGYEMGEAIKRKATEAKSSKLDVES
ncbi:MAG: 2-oxoacid:ferredoxin oxidoreductase subunit gamma [Desulfobacteraceae bacterium]|nr:MAG: 2-oxoacid:ferredoxin oxidoreductase subunit gamma [Desulfobacteraceae bacterium]